jgi:hypothetical protein
MKEQIDNDNSQNPKLRPKIVNTARLLKPRKICGSANCFCGLKNHYQVY